MTLLLILVLVTLVLFALFLGGSLIAQGYLYQQPADRLPLRALAAALLVGLFITSWVWLDQRNPRRYDTFFEFAPYQTQEFNEFQAVRWMSLDGTRITRDDAGNPIEVTVTFRRGVGLRPTLFTEEGTETPFQLNGVTRSGESFMTAAILLRPNPEAEPVRYNAQLNPRARVPTYTSDRRFVEVNGSSYIEADQLGVLYVPSTWTVLVALFINGMLFVVWMIAFWPILRFTLGHAFGLTVVLGLITMLLVMPVLFKPNRVARQAETPATIVTAPAA